MAERNQSMRRIYEALLGDLSDRCCTKAGVAGAVLQWTPRGVPLIHAVSFRDEAVAVLGIKVEVDPLWKEIIGWTEEEIGVQLARHLQPIIPAAVAISIHVEVTQRETLCTIKLGVDKRD